jgi:hypothetical protein
LVVDNLTLYHCKAEIKAIKNIIVPIIKQEIKFEILKFLFTFLSCSAIFILLYFILMKTKKLSNTPTVKETNPNSNKAVMI